ncbi:MAG: aminopeptidase [Clostridia bacterium]|nr:aminopeptidase [Clostridia bacterium]
MEMKETGLTNAAEDLSYEPAKAYRKLDPERTESYCLEYRAFMDASKTERDAVENAVRMAEEAGFRPYEPGGTLSPGDRLYFVNRAKSLMLAVIGKNGAENGFRIVASHIDSPRLDLKPLPLEENSGIAYFKTHYYGGLKKYQWSALPLALHGVVCHADGTKTTVSLGESPDEPVLYISDLMPHIARDQMAKASSDILPGESLSPIVGLHEDETGGVKGRILRLLNGKYGMKEQDFLMSELHLVPAEKSREVGFDRSMICAYGQDDKVCAFAALLALLRSETPEQTAVVFLADKEEIGSQGVTGLRSEAYAGFLRDLCADLKVNDRKAFRASVCISADVGGAYDPHFADAYEAQNSCRLGNGVTISKYTGSRGKSGCSDATAEMMQWTIRMMEEGGIPWQTGEYGKVDQGGAGTVAVDIAKFGIDVIDVGVPLLSMHAPMELAAKCDIYAMYLFCEKFFQM